MYCHTVSHPSPVLILAVGGISTILAVGGVSVIITCVGCCFVPFSSLSIFFLLHLITACLLGEWEGKGRRRGRGEGGTYLPSHMCCYLRNRC